MSGPFSLPERRIAAEQDNSRQLPWRWQGLILLALAVISLSYVASGLFGPHYWMLALRNIGLGITGGALIMIGAEMLSPAKQMTLAALLKRRGAAMLVAFIVLLFLSFAFHVAMDAMRRGYLP